MVLPPSSGIDPKLQIPGFDDQQKIDPLIHTGGGTPCDIPFGSLSPPFF